VLVTSSLAMGRTQNGRRITLAHCNLQSRTRYTPLAPDRFAKFWKE
jgi:hypothetical protein